MPSFGQWTSMICVLSIFALSGCTTVASSCAGFSRNDLSPAGTVALISVDRAGAERVIANDRNFDRLCRK